MPNCEKKLISREVLDKLIAAHDGDIALLYLWLCREGAFNAEKAASDLFLTLNEVNCAYEKLSRMELFAAPKKEAVIAPEEKLPEYTAKDVVSRAKDDEGFKIVIDEAQRAFGRVLSSSDIRTLFGIYDYLAMPPDVIFMLLNYCIESFTARYGAGRLPSMRSIEKEAYKWANDEIITLEQADEYIKKAALRRTKLDEAKLTLNIAGRPLTTTEAKYINAWLDAGFTLDALAVAYDRTVTNTGSLKWPYMNKILKSWHEKGIHSAEEVAEKDRRTNSVRPKNEHQKNASDDELERLKTILEKVKNG